MSHSFLRGGEDARRPYKIFGNSNSPFNISGFLLLEDGDALLFAARLLVHGLDWPKELAMGNIRLEYCEVSEGNIDDDRVGRQSSGPSTLYKQIHFL